MPTVIRPGSDEARVTQMSEACSSHLKDREAGKALLTEELVTAMSEIIPLYRASMGAVKDLKHTRSKEIAEKNDGLITLNYYIRHSWIGLKNRIIREKLPESLLTLYGLPQTGMLPEKSISPKLIETARALIDSDARAVAKGYAPMLNPSAEEVQEAVDAALKELQDTENVDKDLNELEETLAQHRNAADTLINDVIDELHFHLRKQGDSDQRRIIRSYGFTFSSNNSTEPISE